MEKKETVLEMMRRCLSKTAYKKFERNFLENWPADKPANLPAYREIARQFAWKLTREGYDYWNRQWERLIVLKLNEK